MSKQLKLVLAVLGGAIAIAAIMWVLRPKPEQETRVQTAPLVETQVLPLASGPLVVSASGAVEARETVSIAAQVSGRISYVNPAFVEGGSVGSGAVLVRLETADYTNRVRGAQADVAAQRVAVLQAEEEVRIARTELDRFDDRTQDSFAASIDSDDYASRILPPADLQRTRRAATASTPRNGGLATREPQLRSARAALQRAQANLADAELALGRTTIRAPFAASVAAETAAIGAVVQPGQALGELVSRNGYDVRVGLTEAQAALVPGLLSGGGGRIPASVSLDFGDDRFEWSAFVARADAARDDQTRLIDVFLRVPDPQRGGRRVQETDGASSDGESSNQAGRALPLLLGSFVQAQITGASIGTYLAVPVEHLRSDDTLWLVRKGKLAIVPARIVQRTDDTAYVTIPRLTGAVRLVTSTLRAPVNGMAVRVERPAASRATR